MKNNIKKIVTKVILLIMINILIISVFSNVLATGQQGKDKEGSGKDKSSNGNFDTTMFNDKQEETQVDNLINNSTGTIVAVLRVASVAIAIIMLLVISMKYMMSSAGDRADIKKHSIAYATGTFILFGAAQIIAVLIDVADKLFKEE